jgi:hypothetical protein
MGANMSENELEIIQPTALEALTRSEVDVQIATAKKYPRSVQNFKMQAESLATLDPQTAEECSYRLERRSGDGRVKVIDGPSIRLAEICASTYGNLRCAARIVGENERFITAQGTAYDLQSNVGYQVEVQRRITDRNGRRYSDDMVGVTANAACSIALRNAIFHIIPKAWVQQVREAAKKCALGDQKTLPDRRDAAFAYFKSMGVTKDTLLKWLEKPSLEDVTLEDLDRLFGLKTAIKDGDTTVEQAFAEILAKPAKAAESLKDKVKAQRGKPVPLQCEHGNLPDDCGECAAVDQTSGA